MNIEYTDKQVTTHYFKDIPLCEIFMDMDGQLYFRSGTLLDILQKEYNSVNIETGYHKHFDGTDLVQVIKTKLIVEI